MRFLHVADLHLGRKLNDISLLEDQRDILKQIVLICQFKNIDAILICGDIYNNSTPTPETMTLFNDFINELVKNKVKAYIIAGNHDSDQRVAYFSSIAKNVGIYISEEFDGKIEHYTLEDEFGKVNIHLLPFIKPIYVKKFYPEEKIKTYEDAMKVVLKHNPINKNERNILLAHQFITGAEHTDVETLSVGGLDNIDAKVFDDYDYVALGHIHKAQRVGRDTLRYSGSIMKYSFSEENHKKSVTLVEIKNKGEITYELIPLVFKHELRTIKGNFNDLMNMPYSEDYVRIILTNDDVEPDARVSLLTVFPNMVKFSIQNNKTNFEHNVISEDITNKNIVELFKDFYALQNNDCELDEEHLKVLEDTIKEMEDRN